MSTMHVEAIGGHLPTAMSPNCAYWQKNQELASERFRESVVEFKGFFISLPNVCLVYELCERCRTPTLTITLTLTLTLTLNLVRHDNRGGVDVNPGVRARNPWNRPSHQVLYRETQSRRVVPPLRMSMDPRN